MAKLTRSQLASLLAKREGKKSQIKIGDMRETVRILFDLIRDNKQVRDLFIAHLYQEKARKDDT